MCWRAFENLLYIQVIHERVLLNFYFAATNNTNGSNY
jgi:hypothetical protein